MPSVRPSNHSLCLFAIAKHLILERVSAKSNLINLAHEKSPTTSSYLPPSIESPPSLPPRLVLLASMGHALPDLRLATVVHACSRSAPCPPVSFHHAPPPRTPYIRLLIQREGASRRHGISSSLTDYACTAWGRWGSGACICAHWSLTAALAVACLGWRRALDVVVCVWVFACELALETPERRFWERLHCVRVLPFNAPADFWVARTLPVRPVVDQEFVAVC